MNRNTVCLVYHKTRTKAFDFQYFRNLNGSVLDFTRGLLTIKHMGTGEDHPLPLLHVVTVESVVVKPGSQVKVICFISAFQIILSILTWFLEDMPSGRPHPSKIPPTTTLSKTKVTFNILFHFRTLIHYKVPRIFFKI